jgi:hypothetical protein
MTSLGLNNTGSLNLFHSVVNAVGGTFSNLDGSGNLGGGSYTLSQASFLEYTFSGTMTAGSINNSNLLNVAGGSISTGLFTNTASGVVNLGANFVTESITATGLINAGLISFNGGFASPRLASL